MTEESSLQTQTIQDRLADWLTGVFSARFGASLPPDFRPAVAPTANPEFGDYQCNDAMSLAKPLRMAPRKISEALIDGVELHASLEGIDIAGPGFLNMRLKDEWLTRAVSDMSHDERLLTPQPGTGKTVVIDYSSPNVAKPMHIGHIRSTIIGNALDRLHRFLGYRVIADNHVGDWGTQFGIIIHGFRHFVDEKALEESPVTELERVYVKSYERTRKDEEWLQQCRDELVKLQSGDAENLALWERFVALSQTEFERIYRRLGVSFDVVRGESYYRDSLQAMVDRLESAGLAQESEGATVVFLEEEKLPVCIVRKRDGGFNYATTDLATVDSRVQEYAPERVVYVTDVRQRDHFKQIFAICRKLGVEVRLDHVWFGLMRLPEGTFSTREGNVIRLESLLDEAETRALAIVEASGTEMDEAEQREVARAVGIGAVKYADLSQNPQTTVTFTWDKALALDGNSGPYLQYAYARVASLRRKYEERFPGQDPDASDVQFTEPIERVLALKVLRFSEAVVKAAELYRPSMLTDYLYDLAQTYSTFYQTVPFLKAEEGVRESRVRLCGVVAKVLKTGLELLGIETLERI